MRRLAIGRGEQVGGSRLRVRVVAAALLAAAAGVALMVATSGTGEAGASSADPADLSLTKSDNPDPVTEGALLTYTLVVENGGPDDATNVTLRDDLPSQVNPRSATASQGNCQTRGKKVECELGTIANGASATVTIEVTPRKARQITNTASVESEVDDPQTANNRASETTTVTKGQVPRCKKKPATIVGTNASETLTGTEGRDVIVARGGNDKINALGGNDLVCAGAGNDVVRAGGGNDFVKGGRGRDRISGQRGHDELRGNRGRDNLKGGRGNDLLAGGPGRDRCKGGAGNDTLRSCER